MKKIITLLISLLLFVNIPIVANAAEIDEPTVKAKSAILMDMDSMEVLYAKNEHEHLSPASVTKIMSILLVLEAIDSDAISLNDTVTASKNAVSMGGSQIWLEEGESMTVDELLKAVVVASANDACTALGEYVAGSSIGFVKLMNDRAAQLGLNNTSFENCTGLDDSVTNHYSCAYDLAIISSEVMKHELVTEYTTIWLDSLRNGTTELNNTNKLVNTYEGITGLKTGTTSNAGFCVAATASREGLNLVAVVLGSDTSDDRFSTASYLLDWGFANFEAVKPDIDINKIKPVKVINGYKKSIIPVTEPINHLTLEKGKSDIKLKYVIDKTVKAPVKKNQSLGEIQIFCNKDKIDTIKLVSNQQVNRIDLTTIFRHILINI